MRDPVNTQNKNDEYYLPRQKFLTVYHHCLQYSEWIDELSSLGGISGINYDGMPHGSSVGNPTESIVIRRMGIEKKIQDIKDVINIIDPFLQPWLFKGVTENASYTYLCNLMGMPCSRNEYYQKRRKFYFLMSKKLNKEN